jgi:hypothetical protein
MRPGLRDADSFLSYKMWNLSFAKASKADFLLMRTFIGITLAGDNIACDLPTTANIASQILRRGVLR